MLSTNISRFITIPFNITPSERKFGDCRTKAFKQIFDHYGFDYSVQEIFGVGKGLAFSAVECKYGDIPLVSIEGRNFQAEFEFCNQVGVDCREHFLEKNNNIMNEVVPFDFEILKCVNEMNPVLIQCDVFYMDYLNRMNKTHNEYHMLIIIGYDMDKKTISVVDSLLNEVKEISMIELYNAMFSKQYSTEKRGIWYSVSKIERKDRMISNEVHKKSIKELGERFLSSDGDLNKLKELIEFIERILIHAKGNSLNHLKYLEYLVAGICYIVRQQDELNGSCFRTLYLRYLYDTNNSYEELNLDSIISLLEKSEKCWRKISYKLRYSKDDVIIKTQQMIDCLKVIYELEFKVANFMVAL